MSRERRLVLGIAAGAAVILLAAAGVSYRIWSRRERDLLSEYRLVDLPGRVTASLFDRNKEIEITDLAERAELASILEKCIYVPRRGKPVLPLKMILTINFHVDENTHLIFAASGRHGRLFLREGGRKRGSSSYRVPPELARFICRKLGLDESEAG